MLFLCTYRNKVIKQQSLNFGKNQSEQTTEFQLTFYKGVLYTIYLQSNPFRSWFLHDLSHFSCCTCVYALVSTVSHLANCQLYLSPSIYSIQLSDPRLSIPSFVWNGK